MKNRLTSSLFGLLSFGWLHLVYAFLFDYLYWTIELRPKVEFCKSIFKSDACNGIAYTGLWLSELPVLVVGFASFFVVVNFALKHFTPIILFWKFVFGGYLLGYLTLIIFSEYDVSFYAVFSGTYQASICALVLFIVARLAKALYRKN
jgi:hypothetical protein